MTSNDVQQDSNLKPNEQALSVALELAKGGLKVFPCNNDKEPVYGCMWKQVSTTDEKTIRHWFLHKYANEATAVGMPCGLNDLVVLDPDASDGAKQGVEEFEKLIEEHHVDLRYVPVILTPSGGRHYIFQQPEQRVKCGKGLLHDHIDVKGDGGYVVAVGSVRNGRKYVQDPDTKDFMTLFSAGLLPGLPDALSGIIRGPRLATVDGERVDPERMSIDLLRDVMAAIPNDEHFDDRHEWVSIGHSIFGASGGSHEGSDIWRDWSYSRDQTPGEPERVWASFRGGDVRSGAGALRRELERRGLDELAQRARKERTDRMFDDDPDDPEAPQPKDYMKGVWFDGDTPPDPSKHLVEDFILAQDLMFIGGQSGAGKSFTAIQLSVSLTTGVSFFNKKVLERVGVIYVAAEGRTTIGSRLAAAKSILFDVGNLPVAVISDVPNLLSDRDRKEFVQKVIKPVAKMLEERSGLRTGAVIVDTMAAAFDLDDEQASADAAKLTKKARQLGDAIGGVTILVHHYGKDPAAGLRGSSNFRAMGDKVLAVMADRNEATGVCRDRRLVLTKNRDGEEGETVRFDLQTVELGVDADGRPFSAARVRLTGPADQDGDVDGPAGGSSRETTDAALLRAMRAEPRAPQRRWGEIIGKSVSTVNATLERLKKGRFVSQSAVTHEWSIAKKGNEELDKMSPRTPENGSEQTEQCSGDRTRPNTAEQTEQD